MIIHGTPLSIPFSVATDSEPRFWYWYGASGRRFIHSVYRPETCPPLPGAVFLAVRSLGNIRTVLRAGRFAGQWDVNIPAESPAYWESLGANEIHVHLLSRDETEAREIAADLKAALGEGCIISAEESVRRQNQKPEHRSRSISASDALAA